MIRLSRRYRFSASHRLHSPAFTEEENREVFGKCNNPYGHGHNYEIELTVSGPVDPVTGRVVDLALLDGIAEREVVVAFQHRNLNEEISAFRDMVPTTENLAIELDRRLRAAWLEVFGENRPQLERIRIRETDRNICELSGGVGPATVRE